MKKIVNDSLKKIKKQSRDEEISLFGKQIYFSSKVVPSKKKYSRKQKHNNESF